MNPFFIHHVLPGLVFLVSLVIAGGYVAAWTRGYFHVFPRATIGAILVLGGIVGFSLFLTA